MQHAVVVVVSAGAVKGKVQIGKKLREVMKSRPGREGYWPAGLKIKWCFVITTVILWASEGTGNAITKWVTLDYSFAFMAPSGEKRSIGSMTCSICVCHFLCSNRWKLGGWFVDFAYSWVELSPEQGGNCRLELPPITCKQLPVSSPFLNP